MDEKTQKIVKEYQEEQKAEAIRSLFNQICESTLTEKEQQEIMKNGWIEEQETKDE